jgi:hypothetical protein
MEALPGLELSIRANAVLGALVQFWSAKARVPDQDEFDFTGYIQFFGSVKHKLTDTTELATVTITVSAVDNTGAAVGPEKGWLQFYMPTTETQKLQSISEITRGARAQGFVDCFGVDSFGNRNPIGWGIAYFLPSVTENFP